MTLNAIFRWKHPDSTADMNQRLQTLVPRGIFDGGDVTAGGGLTVNVAPFSAIGYDGMLVTDDATQNLTVTAGQTNYVLVRAKYVSGSTPTVQWEVKEQSVYNADPDKNYLIVFAVVTLAGGAVAVTSSDISFLERDAVDPMQRSPFRGLIDNPSLLPSHPPEQNRDGDLYFALNASGSQPGQTWYYWEAATTSWKLFNTGSYNIETGNMGDVLIRGERNRKEQGSGILAGVRPSDDFASETELTIIESPTVADQVGIDTFSATVHGHYVQPHARYITMPAKPGTGTRYDLIFLEAYREAITVPENHDFERNPDGTLTYTITQASDKLEQIAWQAGIAGDNFDLNELQVDDHTWVVTKYRFATVQNVTTASLYDNTAAAASALNVDGNAFAATPGTGIDNRVWRATAATSSADGYSWAIPLYVVKRTASEDHTIGEAIKEFRDDVRYIFPVYAVADTASAGRLTTDNDYRGQPNNATLTPPYDKPSGFLTEMDYEVGPGALDNTIRFYDFNHGGVKVQVRGVEDFISLPSSPDVDLGAPPLTGYERVLVYLKMSQTLYADGTTKDLTYVSDRHRPWFPSDGSTLVGQGWKRGFVTFEVVVHNLGAAAAELDEADAMATAGWTKGDQSLFGTLKYQDGGIWTKAVAIDADDRIHPLLYEWAIPITLVHRRNQAAWSYGTNPNGTGSTRPDSRTLYQIIHPDDLVDLRRLAEVDAARLKEMLEQDIDKLMSGQLRTRMAEKWGGAGSKGDVAGTRILQSDIVDSLGTDPGFSLTAPGNGRKIWSDAREFVPVSTSFTLDADHSDTYCSYVRATGVLTIKAPTGSHLIRNLPPAYITNGTSTSGNYLDFLGEPCWTTQDDYTAAYPTPVVLRYIDAVSGNHEEQPFFTTAFNTGLSADNPAFSVTVSDAMGRATEMAITLTDVGGGAPSAYASADILCVTFWVHYDRTVTGTYASNFGLAEIPDTVHSATKGSNTGSATELNIGTLYTVVRTTVSGSATFNITSADVLSASGTSGTAATIVGFDQLNIRTSASLGGAALSSVTLTDAQDSMTFTYSAPITTDVEVVVYYYTDEVTEWVEVGRGGKSLRGLYSWDEASLDFGGAPANPYAYDLGTSVWTDIEAAGHLESYTPILWTRSGTSGPWTRVYQSVILGAGHRNSNLVAFDPSGVTGMLRYAKVVVPKWTPPASGTSGEILVHYSYTPYQGLSGSGAVATPVSAVPKLEDMLHGTIRANTDYYVSQSGPCSVFGGVDSWSGAAARVPKQEDSLGSDRFSAYNQTQLVSPAAANGLHDLGNNAGAAESLHAAALLRLPFPMNPAMLDGSSIYHKNTWDFDIDPGREGASVGFFSCAPGYWNGLVLINSGNGLHYNQFVNGVTRLAIPGEAKQQDSTLISHACDMQIDTGASKPAINPEYTSNIHQHRWILDTAGDQLYGDSSLSCQRGHVLGLTATRIDNLDASDLDGFGTRLLSPVESVSSTAPASYFADAGGFTYTSPVALNNNNSVYVCSAPGTVHAWMTLVRRESYPFIRIGVDAGLSLTNDTEVHSTLAVQEAPRTSYSWSISPTGFASNATINTDLIRLPLTSNSLSAGTTSLAYGISGASLVGREIGYPPSWGASTQTTLTGKIVASISIHSGYGRGLYFGSTTVRVNMPVFVPGSGTSLFNALSNAVMGPALIEKTAQPPDAFPTGPTSSPFATSPKQWLLYDHGGPIAYGFYGLTINPSSTTHGGQAVMQISGGPFMGTGSTTLAQYSSDMLDGTAIDAFWPSKRPLIKPGQ